MTHKFVIFSLPRSRSFWLSRFLSFGEHQCGHDIAIGCANAEDFLDAFDLVDGTVETGAVLGWRLVRHRLPLARLIVVRRPLVEVQGSFARLGIPVDPYDLLFKALQLDQLASQSGVEVVEYHELADETTCARLFETCVGRAHSSAWWRAMNGMNLQVNMTERLNVLQLNALRIAQFKTSVAQQCAMLGTGGLN